jgi:dimeric dUTPase (all-alpha-NTP-PPase superfamily)
MQGSVLSVNYDEFQLTINTQFSTINSNKLYTQINRMINSHFGLIMITIMDCCKRACKKKTNLTPIYGQFLGRRQRRDIRTEAIDTAVFDEFGTLES